MALTSQATPTTTAERADLIASTASHFPLLGRVTPGDLCKLVEAELGDALSLDRFRPHGNILSRAVAPDSILHIVSGNTPHAGLQSVIRGLLLGSHNRVKLPSSGIPELLQFGRLLPKPLADLVEFSDTVSPLWQRSSDVIVVFGSDATIAKFRSRTHPRQKFIAHGHKISMAMVFEDDTYQSVSLAARDVALFNQQGCLSPHCLYVASSNDGLNPKTYAEKLADALAVFEAENPRGEIDREAAAEIAHLRTSYRFRAANDPRVAVWESTGSTAWTVIYEDESQFAVSPLNRFIFVKPLPEIQKLPDALKLVRPYLSTISIHPHEERQLPGLGQLGAHRICALGSAQYPSLFWHHDGAGVLSPFVDWVDFG